MELGHHWSIPHHAAPRYFNPGCDGEQCFINNFPTKTKSAVHLEKQLFGSVDQSKGG
jgi:hypothetical protein